MLSSLQIQKSATGTKIKRCLANSYATWRAVIFFSRSVDRRRWRDDDTPSEHHFRPASGGRRETCFRTTVSLAFLYKNLTDKKINHVCPDLQHLLRRPVLLRISFSPVSISAQSRKRRRRKPLGIQSIFLWRVGARKLSVYQAACIISYISG